MTKIKKEIDQEFLEFLEYRICKFYEQLRPKERTKHWCKEVTIFGSGYNYSREYVIENREVLLKAFVDKYGFTEYNVHLKFGTQSLSLYSKGLDIKKSVPGYKDPNLFAIDFENKTITISLS
ncbi:hypothetical protein J2X31_001765 [Flavobacterium arsenatis]|uniref:Uncharacterized protein n=1 Tax=Flavobacterium arsenatis TaxID=1484332 RepID=A0ABU1TP55_9FLAO|nr:hypothetical protein [Flavobacterium arsenatis]MDR6967753.1 hypothetical protein [Flavobacterium arsenatis]